MPTLRDTLSRTTLSPADVDWLHRLVGDWQMVADLSFADLTLWIPVALDDGATLEITHPRAQLGAQLRGHLGFSDFNARLRNDAPALLEMFIDDALAARWTLSDSQGWAAFAAPTSPGTHAVRLRLTPLLGGTWTEQGYAANPRRTACLELRALAEATP